MHHNVVSKIYDFYQFPSKIIRFITESVNLKESHSYLHSNVTLRLVKKTLRKNKVHIKLQIINSRATYSAYIMDVISDYNFISSCEKISLIEIGYFSKVEEYTRMQQLEFNNLDKISGLRLFLNKFKKNNSDHVDGINPEEFNYHFINIDCNNGQSDINLLIASTKLIFKVPFNDLILDSSLLGNIYPPDLLRIGYEICCIDIREKKQPAFSY